MCKQYYIDGMILLKDLSENRYPLVDIMGTIITRNDMIRSKPSPSDGEYNNFSMLDEEHWGEKSTQIDGL
jgi:hypothetical protein